MNERIKELAEQAGFRIEIQFGMWCAHPEELERFVELIVRECIDAVSDCSVEYCTRPQIVSEIKEHFGVSE